MQKIIAVILALSVVIAVGSAANARLAPSYDDSWDYMLLVMEYVS